ncbi:MAG: hypothetical protein RSA10_01185 [Bacilli bacterium]
MLNNKGFAVSSILYTFLVCFLLFLGGTLAIISSSSSMITTSNEDLIQSLENLSVTSGTKMSSNTSMNWYQTSKQVKISSRKGVMYWPEKFSDYNSATAEIAINKRSDTENGIKVECLGRWEKDAGNYDFHNCNEGNLWYKIGEPKNGEPQMYEPQSAAKTYKYKYTYNLFYTIDHAFKEPEMDEIHKLIDYLFYDKKDKTTYGENFSVGGSVEYTKNSNKILTTFNNSYFCVKREKFLGATWDAYVCTRQDMKPMIYHNKGKLTTKNTMVYLLPGSNGNIPDTYPPDPFILGVIQAIPWNVYFMDYNGPNTLENYSPVKLIALLDAKFLAENCPSSSQWFYNPVGSDKASDQFYVDDYLTIRITDLLSGEKIEMEITNPLLE